MKETTKECPHCGATNLVMLRSLNRKICGKCLAEIPWFVDKGQKPLLGK